MPSGAAHFCRGRPGCAGSVLSSPHDEAVTMISIFLKIALLAVLVILTFGVFPDRRKGWIVAIGTCIAGAVFLHFVAP
jgi:uncharacterized BrkB/YihY/UPF0761 family membrane protein